jgi:hypothetical protein
MHVYVHHYINVQPREYYCALCKKKSSAHGARTPSYIYTTYPYYYVSYHTYACTYVRKYVDRYVLN